MEEIGIYLPIEAGKLFVLVSRGDYDYVVNHRWTVDGKGYVYRRWMINGKFYREWLHQYVVGKDSKLEGEHRNQNKLDCRRCNLRKGTHSQNLANRVQRNVGMYSKYRGVTRDNRKGKYVAQVQAKMVHYFLGYFDSEVDAALAYDVAAKEYFGEFARLNFESQT